MTLEIIAFYFPIVYRTIQSRHLFSVGKEPMIMVSVKKCRINGHITVSAYSLRPLIPVTFSGRLLNPEILSNRFIL